MVMAKITWTSEKLKRFEIVYNRAVAEQLERFTFEGHGFMTAYAKHLLAYLKQRL